MSAFLVTYPRDRIRLLLLFGWFTRGTFIPAVLLIGLWFLNRRRAGSLVTGAVLACGVKQRPSQWASRQANIG
jgi:Na+/proline symporter